jgi:glycosyltransferase involved in cell wall biosynthesis
MTHNEDLRSIRTAVSLVRGELGSVDFVVVGGTQVDSSWYRRIEVPFEHVDYPRFVPWIRGLARHCSIGLAPLLDTQFNSFKSAIKFQDYTMMHLAGVFSNVTAYQGCVDRGANGLLADESPESWAQAIISLLKDADLRHMIKSDAFQRVSVDTVENSLDDWHSLIQGVLDA